MEVPAAILALVMHLVTLPSGSGYEQLASIAWAIEGEVSYSAPLYYGDSSIRAARIVGCTVVNRVTSPYFPSTPYEVITQPEQYNPIVHITSVSHASVHIALDVYAYPDRYCDRSVLFVFSRTDLRNLNWLLRRHAAVVVAETEAWGIYGFDRYPARIPLAEVIASLDIGLVP